MGIDDEMSAHIAALRTTVAESSGVIAQIAVQISACFVRSGKLLICGNGGSAADSQHLAAEFMNRFRRDRQPWPAIALSTDTSVLTSISNDAAYDDVFARQVSALARPGDVILALSTSGRSTNVLGALTVARERGLVTVGMTGRDGTERMGPLCDLLLAVPSDDTARIQECHEFACHVIAGMVEAEMLHSDPANA